MAYMSKENKAIIAAQLKTIMPAGWKYSLAVSNHSTIVCTIASAPVDLATSVDWYNGVVCDMYDVNPYHYQHHVTNAELLATIQQIMTALNHGNYDHSDSMTDYFCVGHYVKLQFGRWNKAFVNTSA